MGVEFVSGGVLFLCAVSFALRDIKSPFQQSPSQPQIPIEVECKHRFLFISVAVPSSGVNPRFEAVDATGVYPVTDLYGVQCGYTYSVDPQLGRVVLRASYFSCHTDNKNDEVFTFMFGVIITDERGGEFFFNVSKTCSVAPFPPREITCEENYMEVSVTTDLCPTSGSIKCFSVPRSSVEPWQVMLQQDGRQSELMSPDNAAALGYYFMITPGRLVFRTTFGQPYASVKMDRGVAVEVIQATVFFKQNWMVVMVELVASCSLDKGSFDGHRLHGRTPAVKTPLATPPSELRSGSKAVGVNGELLDKQKLVDRGYSVTSNEGAVVGSVPFASVGGTRKSFVRDSMHREREIYNAPLTNQQMFVDQNAVDPKYKAFQQMATTTIPRVPFSINQTTPGEQVFQVYLGNIPSNVELMSLELNGQEFSVSTAMQMGISITRVRQDNSTFAYIVRVPFDAQYVKKQHIAEHIWEYSLEIKWTLAILPQMEPYFFFSSLSASAHDLVPPVFNVRCASNGVRFMRAYQEYDYLWDIVIGKYPLTQQLVSERGYIMSNESNNFILDVPLFTIGYHYENITLQQFYGTFELLTRNAKTLEIEQSSGKCCLFQTTELLVCSADGVMTVVRDLTKAVPLADPTRTTLLDPSCRPRETDERRVLFSFGLNTCGTRFQVDRQYVTYENELIFHELYSTDSRPVITRDAAYRITVRCIYPVRGTESLFVDRLFRAEAPGIGQIKDPVMVPPQFASRPCSSLGSNGGF
ncbi:zona pellucida sperm-binding protein [Pimephales promelas]|nr:zona pellucida sperm-binding protein [Pimephales promelas]